MNQGAPDGWKKVLDDEMMEIANDSYVQSDPPRMHKVMRQAPNPASPSKILAVSESRKLIDGIYVGMFPRVRDGVRENAGVVQRILTRA